MNPEHEQANATHSGPDVDEAVPSGNHPLEIAARHGFGPLSAAAGDTWHGNATPCVTCGQLVPRDARQCLSCGQDLSPAMLEKMRAHAGPWYVLEHLRPFPGVNLERIVKQIRRGLINETSIVRGPATAYQWRFALETPGLCRYFGKCWRCFSPVGQSETACQQCGAHLTFEPTRPAGSGWITQPPAAGAAPPTVGAPPSPHSDAAIAQMSSNELDRLRAVLHEAPVTGSRLDEPARVGGVRVSWIAAGLVTLAVIALFVISRQRSSAGPEPATPRATAPAPAANAD